MKRIILSIVTVFALAAVCDAAQKKDGPKPGIYSVKDTQLTAMVKQKSTEVCSELDWDLFVTQKFQYRGSKAKMTAEGDFLLVCNPSKKKPLVTLRKFAVFTKKLTPDDMMIVPLDVRWNKRVYDCSKLHSHRGKVQWNQVDFTWEKVDECTYRIKSYLEPGEYAIVFRYNLPSWNFDFSHAFPFRVE